MKLIPLTQGKFAQVDDADFDYLNQWKWQYHSSAHAQRTRHIPNSKENGKWKRETIHMHRLLLDAKEVDHRDRDGLNNQRHNLRECKHSQNTHNVAAHRDSTSKFKGVCWYEKGSKWQAQIYINKRQTYLGRYNSEIEAAKAYNVMAQHYHGEFAVLNKVA